MLNRQIACKRTAAQRKISPVSICRLNATPSSRKDLIVKAYVNHILLPPKIVLIIYPLVPLRYTA
jgi:hypothetical protein